MKLLLFWIIMAVAIPTVTLAAVEDQIEAQWAAAVKAGDAAKLDKLL